MPATIARRKRRGTATIPVLRPAVASLRRLDVCQIGDALRDNACYPLLRQNVSNRAIPLVRCTVTVSRRWFFRSAAGAVPLILFPVSPALARQDVTPTPRATVTVPGFIEGATRNFQAPAGRLVGTGFISALVVITDTDEHAAAAFPDLVDYYRDYLYRDQTESISETLRPASTPDLGDEAAAYAGEFADPKNPNALFLAAIFCWREGPIIYENFALSRGVDPLPDLFAVGRKITGREQNNDPVSVPASPQEMHTGGVWDLLPTLADVPEGLVFLNDEAGP